MRSAALTVITLCTVAAILAVRTSPWYVTAAGTGLLVLSVRTVESHIYRAMHKLGVSDRRDL